MTLKYEKNKNNLFGDKINNMADYIKNTPIYNPFEDKNNLKKNKIYNPFQDEKNKKNTNYYNPFFDEKF